MAGAYLFIWPHPHPRWDWTPFSTGLDGDEKTTLVWAGCECVCSVEQRGLSSGALRAKLTMAAAMTATITRRMKSNYWRPKLGERWPSIVGIGFVASGEFPRRCLGRFSWKLWKRRVAGHTWGSPSANAQCVCLCKC